MTWPSGCSMKSHSTFGTSDGTQGILDALNEGSIVETGDGAHVLDGALRTAQSAAGVLRTGADDSRAERAADWLRRLRHQGGGGGGPPGSSTAMIFWTYARSSLSWATGCPLTGSNSASSRSQFWVSQRCR